MGTPSQWTHLLPSSWVYDVTLLKKRRPEDCERQNTKQDLNNRHANTEGGTSQEIPSLDNKWLLREEE